jgi:hypothetical protein
MQEMLETTKDMHDIGIMDDASYRKITMRDINRAEAATLAPVTGVIAESVPKRTLS